MGKFRSKLKGQTKGKRWPKGQSSSSNPTTQKFRSLAKSSFFQENLGSKSGLTVNALQKHDAIQNYAAPSTSVFGELAESLHSVKIEHDDVPEAALETTTQSCGTFRTFQTFASDWSECTNASFSKLLNGFKSDSALHKEMLAILAAITELLKEKDGKQTSTEYYMALMEILNQDQEENGVHATLSLLSMGIKSVPESVIKLRFSESSKIFMELLEKYCNTENQNLLRCLLGCISVQLRAIDLAQWANSSTLQMFDAVMAFSIHTKPKLRKSAQHAVCAIIRGSCFMLKDDSPKLHPAAGKVARFCMQQLKPELEASSQTTILHILTLLKDVLYMFPKDDIKVTCERILSMMTANNVLVRTCCLQTLHSLFLMSSDTKIKNLTDEDMIELNKRKYPATNLTSTLAAKLIKALYDYRPDKNDVRQTVAWITVVQQGQICLSCLDSDLSINILPQFVTTCTNDLWLSEQADIANAGTIALREILYEAIAPICKTLLQVQKHKTVLEKIFQTITRALTIPFGHAADKVVNILAVCFDVAGRNCAELLEEPLTMLGERRNPSAHMLGKSQFGQIDHAIATAVKSMGPEFVLKCIPITDNSGEIDLNRTWVLPILRDKIRGSTLEFFGSQILRLASACKRVSEQCSQEGKKNDSITYNLLCTQLWGLFPGFCNSPTDIKDSFKKIAKILGDTLTERPDLRTSVLQGLRKLINSAEREEINELARFSKNYIPLLLNIYLTPSTGGYEQGQRLSALETIQLYLTITPLDKSEEIFNNLLNKIADAENQNDTFLKEALFDIARAMSVYQSEDKLKELYSKLLPLCEPSTEKENKKEKVKNTLQKKAFKIIEDVLKSDKEGCKEFVKNHKKQLQSVVMKSLNTSAENSRATRLRSLELLVKSQPQLDCESKLVRSCIAEAILSTRDLNAKCRKCAQSLLITVGETIESKKKNGLSDYINVMIAGLAGTQQMIAATLQALACVTFHFSGSLGKETLDFLLTQVCALLASPTREITVAAVNYIIVFTKSLPAPQVALSLKQIMTAIGSMNEDCKRHARLEIGKLLTRMSRKYSAETLTKLTPGDDIVTHKRLRNLRKQQSRTKRLKEIKKNQSFDEDEEFLDVRSSVKSIEEILADSDSDDVCDNDNDVRNNKVQKSKKNKDKGKSLIHETEDSIIDLVDVSAASKILSSKPETSKTDQKKVKPNRGFKTADDGRLVIDELDGNSSEDEYPKKKKIGLNLNSDSDSDDDMNEYDKPILGKRKRSDVQSVKSGISGMSEPQAKYKAGGHGIHRSLSGASVKSGASGKSYRSIAKSSKSSADFGSEYKSSKAAGDVKRKGRPDPYAYMPLVRSSLNKRKRAKNAGQFRGIVKSARKGAAIGTKLRKKKM